MLEHSFVKSDVPFTMRAPALKAGVVFVITVWVIVIVLIPGFRPNTDEILVGILSGIPWGLLYSFTFIAYVADIARRCRHNPRLKVIASIYRVSTLKAWLVFLVGVGFMAWGLFVIFPIIDVLEKTYLASCDELIFLSSHVSGETLQWARTMLVFLSTIALITAIRTIRFYNNLRSE